MNLERQSKTARAIDPGRFAIEHADMADDDGQSARTKEWLARRDAADRAIENVRQRTEAEEQVRRRDAENRVNESPILFIVSVIAAGIVIVGGLWWFITAVQCDPLISDRGLSSACK